MPQVETAKESNANTPCAPLNDQELYTQILPNKKKQFDENMLILQSFQQATR